MESTALLEAHRLCVYNIRDNIKVLTCYNKRELDRLVEGPAMAKKKVNCIAKISNRRKIRYSKQKWFERIV